jgi:hypothetical protein
MGRLKYGYIMRLITLANDYIKLLSLYILVLIFKVLIQLGTSSLANGDGNLCIPFLETSKVIPKVCSADQ